MLRRPERRRWPLRLRPWPRSFWMSRLAGPARGSSPDPPHLRIERNTEPGDRRRGVVSPRVVIHPRISLAVETFAGHHPTGILIACRDSVLVGINRTRRLAASSWSTASLWSWQAFGLRHGRWAARRKHRRTVATTRHGQRLPHGPSGAPLVILSDDGVAIIDRFVWEYKVNTHRPIEIVRLAVVI